MQVPSTTPGEGCTGGDVEVAPDLYCLPFWTPAFCAAVIRAAELIGFEPNPDDPVPRSRGVAGDDQPGAVLERSQDDIGVRIWPQLQTCGR